MPFTLSTAEAVARVRELDRRVNVYINTRLPEALRDAETRAAEAPRSRLHGLPYGLKDEFETVCLPTTAGSYRHRERVPEADGAVYEAFEAAGAILIGKTNLSDLGLPPEATSYIGGATRNPFDRRRTAGGSSGGSAAAVAYGMGAFDWGADIGGSIRLPAAFCGVLGMRLASQTWPTDREGFFPRVPPGLAWMNGQGPFTRTTAQMRVVLDTVAPRLRTGTDRPFTLRGALIYPPAHGRWPSFTSELTPALRAAIDGPVAVLGDELPSPSKIQDVYSGVWASHFEELLDADDTMTLGRGLLGVFSSLVFRGLLGDRRFHPTSAELLLLITIGRFTLFRDRAACLARAHAIRDAFRALWDQGWLVVSPVTAYPPPVIGRSNWNPRLLAHTMPGNLADATGLSIPFGRFGSGLPRSIQLLGPPGCEGLLLDVADRLPRPNGGASSTRGR